MALVQTERQQLESAIAALESQRANLGPLVDAAIAPLAAKLAELRSQGDVRTAPESTLRQVTIVFLDIVGSTSLSRHLDPEEIHAVIDGALARFTRVVERFQGRVLQYAGDSLLAAFGADEAQEDDAERAVRCGLALIDECAAGRDAIRGSYGLDDFGIRVGAHTGGVLLGGGVDAEATIRGISVNVAARMEQTAPPGRLRISQDTWRLVRGTFEVEPQEAMTVKGLDQPLASYLVTRPRPRAFRVASRGIEGLETAMVGRDDELERLVDDCKRARTERRLVATTVVGDAGLGKSRLLHEFERSVAALVGDAPVLRGRAHPQMQGRPYALLRDVLWWHLQISDSDTMDSAKTQFEAGTRAVFATDGDAAMAEAQLHLLGHMVGLHYDDSPHLRGIRDDGRQIRNRGFHAAARLFRRLSAASTTGSGVMLLVLDDLHWADEGSMDFLNYLIQVDHDVAMHVVALTRPTLFERRGNWFATSGSARIDLAALGRTASRLLANELLKKLDDVPAALRDLVTGGAEGNPFYMEELVKMLVDEGAIEIGPDRWTVKGAKLSTMHVPQTLTGVLQARLDGLSAEERRTLQHASVVGFVFWDEALAAIDRHDADALPSLVQRELAIPHAEARVEGVREYAFKHQILHQVTYDTLLKRARREVHAKVAAWLAGLGATRSGDLLGITADHYERAGDTANAARCFVLAAEHAAARFGHEAALAYADRAARLFGEDPSCASDEVRWRFHDVRERTLDTQGQRDAQRVEIEALRTLADALDDDRKRSDVVLRESVLAMRTSDYRLLERVGREAIAWGERLGALDIRLLGEQRVCTALYSQGQVDEAEAMAVDALMAAKAHGLRMVESLLLNALVNIAGQRNDMLGVLETSRNALVIDREIGDRRREATTLANIGTAWLSLGEWAEARTHLEEALTLARSIGHRAIEPFLLCNLSALAQSQDDDASALAHARAALAVATAIQGPLWEVVATYRIGNAELALGRHDAARDAFLRAYRQAAELQIGHRCDAAAGLARVALAEGDLAAALDHLQEILDHLAGGGNLEGTETPNLVRLTCFQALEQARDARAQGVLEAAYRVVRLRADAIDHDALRETFLARVPEHRDIVSAWNRRSTAASPRGVEDGVHGVL